MKISQEEIKKRLIRLRNLESLHIKARKRIVTLLKENKRLKQRIKELEEKDKNKGERIETMAFQLEQIQNKLFGKKPIVKSNIKTQKRKDRDIASYTRPIPKETTKTITHRVTNCSCCNGTLQHKRVRTFFEEDIPLPTQKTVTKYHVWSGYCKVCLKQTSAINIPSKCVVLGSNVRKYVCTLSIVSRLSHSQIQDHLKDVFDFQVSIGEIGNILEKEANNLRPEYQRLKQSIQKQSAVHYDETSWRVEKEEFGKYAWVATGIDNNEVLFMLGKSRGKGNIEELGVSQIGISDDYGAYRNTFSYHQLCFAHPHRKLRDMAESAVFKDTEKHQIEKTYKQFSNLYQKIRERPKPDVSLYMKRKFQTNFNEITMVYARDPSKLKKLKESLLKNKEKYFTFLKYPNIPIDNNKAERALRHLVIKRKTSFGSKTKRGAENTSILASVILSLKWCDPKNWFKKYLTLTT